MFKVGPLAIGLIVLVLALVFINFYVKPPKIEEE